MPFTWASALRIALLLLLLVLVVAACFTLPIQKVPFHFNSYFSLTSPSISLLGRSDFPFFSFSSLELFFYVEMRWVQHFLFNWLIVWYTRLPRITHCAPNWMVLWLLCLMHEISRNRTQLASFTHRLRIPLSLVLFMHPNPQCHFYNVILHYKHHICIFILVIETFLNLFPFYALQILEDFLTWVDRDLGPWGPVALYVNFNFWPLKFQCGNFSLLDYYNLIILILLSIQSVALV